MLPVPTPFPQVGSYALVPVDGRNQLARIQERLADGRVHVSLPFVPDVATGAFRVPLDQLIDGTPLTEAERAELDRLSTEILAAKRPSKAKKDRADALRRRDIHAGVLAELVAKVPVATKRRSIAELAA